MAGRREREDEVAANIMSIACVCSLSFFPSFFLDHSSSQQLSMACAAHAFILHTAVPPKKKKGKKQTGGSDAKERRETRRDGKNNTRKKERAKKKRKEN